MRQLLGSFAAEAGLTVFFAAAFLAGAFAGGCAGGALTGGVSNSTVIGRGDDDAHFFFLFIVIEAVFDLSGYSSASASNSLSACA